MAEKTYGIHDKWTDLDKLNDVDIESIDGVITGIKVNGEDYGGGGGSSDFSTAVLSIVDEGGYPVNLNAAIINERGFSLGGYPNWSSTDDLTVILYKGRAMAEIVKVAATNISISGDIELLEDDSYAITGDCTITIS